MNLYREAYDDIFRYVKMHHDWFRSSLPMIAVREVVASDFGNRYAEKDIA